MNHFELVSEYACEECNLENKVDETRRYDVGVDENND